MAPQRSTALDSVHSLGYKRVGGVKYTVKGGVIYDARALLADVREMVRRAKAEEGFEIVQPGLEAGGGDR